MHDIPESWGTACNVQAMVFGNLGDDSRHRRRVHARSRRPASAASIGEYALGRVTTTTRGSRLTLSPS